MIEIILLFFVGKHFYTIAEIYNSNKWLWGILGVVSYFVGSAIGGVILGISDGLFDLGIDWENGLLMSVIAIPFGFGAVFIFQYLLKRHFEANKPEKQSGIQDIGRSSQLEKPVSIERKTKEQEDRDKGFKF